MRKQWQCGLKNEKMTVHLKNETITGHLKSETITDKSSWKSRGSNWTSIGTFYSVGRTIN